MPDLEPGIIEKLVAAGITTVEAVADMTPEQLEEVPGIGPKTVEKISIAVNNYFASLDAAADGCRMPARRSDEDVPVEEEARELEAERRRRMPTTEAGETPREKLRQRGETPEEVEAAERDDRRLRRRRNSPPEATWSRAKKAASRATKKVCPMNPKLLRRA